MSDGEIVQKQGEIIAVLPQKSGFTEIQIQEEGRQYPYKASTKLPEIIEAANAGLFQQAVMTAKEVDSGNPNPHNPGTNYINRMAMKVEVGGTLSDQPASSSGSAPASRNGGGSSRGGATDRSIERQVILKEMVQHYPGLDKLDVAAWWDLMGRLDNFMVNGPAVDAHGQTADDIPF